MDVLLRQTLLGALIRTTFSSRLRYTDEHDPAVRSKLKTLQHRQSNNTHEDETTALLADVDRSYDPESVIVEWYDPADPENPINWPLSIRILTTFVLFVTTVCMYIGSSFWSVCIEDVVTEFDVSETLAHLGTSVFILGFGIGPMIWSPLSEIPSVGRVKVYFWTAIPYLICSIVIPLSPSIGLIILMRFLTGVLCSPVLAVGGGTVADMFGPLTRGYPIAFWELSTWGGSVAGATMAAPIYERFGWKGPMWELVALGMVGLILIICLVPETYPATIIHHRAQRLKQVDQTAKFLTHKEISESRQPLLSIIKSLLIKSIKLNFQEPIVFVLNSYVALILATVFGMLESYPFVFANPPYNFTKTQIGLALDAIIPGGLVAMIAYFLFLRFHQIHQFDDRGNIAPEQRLWPAIPGGFFLPLALFWYGWSAERELHWLMPALGGFWFGIGGFAVFMAVLTYLPDAYPSVAATVLAGNCLIRALLSAAFPLFTTQFYRALGPGWASSVIGFLAVVFVPWPIVLYRRGKWLRNRSPHARQDI